MHGTLTLLNPTSYSFTDGEHVFDPTTVENVVGFSMATDAQGLPSIWDITLQTAIPPMRALGTMWGTLERDISNQTYIEDIQPGGSAACYNCAKGTWDVTTDTTPVPEPSAFVLLGAGLFGIGTIVRVLRLGLKQLR
jgi:hypothetical protein